MKKNSRTSDLISENRRASFDYFLSDFIEVGIVLKGTEIKAIRKHNVALKDTYVYFKNGEAFIENMHIPQYEHGNIFNHEPLRTRKLLMHRKEINKYAAAVQVDSYTCIPTKIYYKRGRVKLLLALGKGKKNYDKRDAIKKRESDLNIRKAIKQGARHDE